MSSRSSESLGRTEFAKQTAQRQVAQKKKDVETLQNFMSRGRQLATKGQSITAFAPNRVQALRLGVDPDEIDSLVNSFLSRQRQIKQRRSQPGRSGLFLARSS